jgi:neutral trehalase
MGKEDMAFSLKEMIEKLFRKVEKSDDSTEKAMSKIYEKIDEVKESMTAELEKTNKKINYLFLTLLVVAGGGGGASYFYDASTKDMASFLSAVIKFIIPYV